MKNHIRLVGWWIGLFVLSALNSGCICRSEDDKLISRLRDPSPKERFAAAEEAARSRCKSKALVATLIETLQDPNGLGKGYIVIALNRIGSPAVEDLITTMKHKDPRVRALAIWAVGHPTRMIERGFSPSDDETFVPVLIQALGDQNAEVRVRAVESLEHVSPNTDKTDLAVKGLIAVLEDRDEHVQRDAAGAIFFLARRGASSESLASAVQPLIKLSRSSSAHRTTAIRALGRIGDTAKDAIPELVNCLKNKDDGVRSAAHDALRDLNGARKDAIPLLVQLLHDENPDYRIEAIHAFCGIGPFPGDYLPVLLAALKDPVAKVRIFALAAMRDMGRNHTAPPEPMLAALKDSSLDVRVTAAFTLWKLTGRTDGVRVLVEGLNATDKEIREYAAARLGDIGPEARAAIPALLKAADSDENKNVRATASTSLGKIDRK
jgi:HEAT repeat protein